MNHPLRLKYRAQIFAVSVFRIPAALAEYGKVIDVDDLRKFT
jgi:hypothetical protein